MNQDTRVQVCTLCAAQFPVGSSHVCNPNRTVMWPSMSGREVDPNWKNWSPSEYLLGLSHERANQGFKRDMDALVWCDACVYVMPCGPSASMEMGYAKGAGKLVIVYVPDLREPDLMVKMADLVTNNFSDVLRAMEVLQS